MIEDFGELFLKTLGVFIILTLSFFIVYLPFSSDKKPIGDEEKKQVLCEHKWCEIGNFASFITVYCPVCDKEETMRKIDWNKMKAKLDYEQNHAVGK